MLMNGALEKVPSVQTPLVPVHEVSGPVNGVDDPRGIVSEDTFLAGSHGLLTDETKSKNDSLHQVPQVPGVAFP